jgi:DNA-directed RNA polymerase subunit RPC12/RpoP
MAVPDPRQPEPPASEALISGWVEPPLELKEEPSRENGTATAAMSAPTRPKLNPRPLSGRRFGFNCAYCSSRLEAVESQSGDQGACPTCGNNIVIPICDRYGRLIDPLTGKIIKQDPHPVHAYAAAGERAPQILRNTSGEQSIRCARCTHVSPISSNNCKSCGIPFTMEGTTVDAASNNSGMAVASLVLGIIGLITPCLVVPALLSVVFGAIAFASAQRAEGQGKGMAIAGLVIGGLGLLFSFYFYAR